MAEVHDCFTIAEICVIEELGLVERGKGSDAAVSGLTALGGKIPVNPSGGLKAKGHPVGATGVGQICEAVKQLRADAGERRKSHVFSGKKTRRQDSPLFRSKNTGWACWFRWHRGIASQLLTP